MTVKKNEYSSEFEKLWATIDKPRSSSRKEQAYKVFQKMEEETKDLNQQVNVAVLLIASIQELHPEVRTTIEACREKVTQI